MVAVRHGRIHPCPCRCGRSFRDRVTVIHHLETGTCPSGITRAKVEQAMLRADQTHFFTADATRQQTNPTDWRVATDESHDPKRDLYVCAHCHNGFKTLLGLNAHLSWPRHTLAGARGEKPYKCPSTDCHKQFTTLSGAVHHATNGSCGVTLKRDVDKTLKSILRQLGQLKV